MMPRTRLLHQGSQLLTSLGVEEHQGLVKGERVVVGRRVFVVVARDRVHDKRDESGEECGEENRAHGPYEDLAADDDAAEIHVLLLLLFAGSQEPTLLRLVQGPRQRRPVQVLQVPAPLLLRGGVRRIDLQRPTPRISTVHSRSFCFFHSNNATDTTHNTQHNTVSSNHRTHRFRCLVLVGLRVLCWCLLSFFLPFFYIYLFFSSYLFFGLFCLIII